MGLILIVAGDLGDKEYAELFNQMYLSVCFSFRPPSRVCESKAVCTIEKNRVSNHLTQLYAQVNGTRRVASEGAREAQNVIVRLSLASLRGHGSWWKYPMAGERQTSCLSLGGAGRRVQVTSSHSALTLSLGRSQIKSF